MILHRTWKHNRPDILWKDRHTNIDYVVHKTAAEYGKYPCPSPK